MNGVIKAPMARPIRVEDGGTGQQTAADAFHALSFYHADDIDAAGVTGFSGTNPGSGGTFPENVNRYGILFVLSTSNTIPSGYTVQIWFSITDSSRMFVRTRWDDNTSFTSWRIFEAV